jgi:hypothetical protein
VLLPHPGERGELEPEERRVVDVPVAAAVPDHRVVLDRLEVLAAGEPAELVAAQVGRTVGHRPPRGESPGDRADRRGEVGDDRLGPPGRDQGRGVTTLQRPGQEQFSPEKADAVDG